MGENAQKYSYVPKITFSSSSIETEKVFDKQIVGNENSSVSELITKLGNSDWVKSGLKFIPEEPIEENKECPFCQEKTISNDLIQNIKDYFDASYESDINYIKKIHEEYLQAIQQIPNKTTFESNPKFEAFKKDFEIKFSAFSQLVESNRKKIDEKIKNPSIPQTLEDSTESLKKVNEIISEINVETL
jgi:wobble nucleotide-excising tRNase